MRQTDRHRVPASQSPELPPAPLEPIFELDDVLGRRANDVDAILGSPALIRREGNGEFRRYGLRDCALIVILYPDEQGVVRVAHVDAAALRSSAPKPDVQRCLAAG